MLWYPKYARIFRKILKFVEIFHMSCFLVDTENHAKAYPAHPLIIRIWRHFQITAAEKNARREFRSAVPNKTRSSEILVGANRGVTGKSPCFLNCKVKFIKRFVLNIQTRKGYSVLETYALCSRTYVFFFPFSWVKNKKFHDARTSNIRDRDKYTLSDARWRYKGRNAYSSTK